MASKLTKNCDACKHSWVTHAIEKLRSGETVAFDGAALLLYGVTAIPVRLKILLDRLLSTFKRHEMLGILAAFGWTLEDYNRGYIMQDQVGRVVESWTMVTRDEENLILQQFLKMPEFRSIAQDLLEQDVRDSLTPQASPKKAAEEEPLMPTVFDPRLIAYPLLSPRFLPFGQPNEEKLRSKLPEVLDLSGKKSPSNSTTTSSSGKKRVLCTACNKTFCDKGALKIHYSAVHLKEMHKCTVEGCSMTFSSRRSRNRHSANPNPKLHCQKKREILPNSKILNDVNIASILTTEKRSNKRKGVPTKVTRIDTQIERLTA
ncbi:DgyrCDS2484 [Dimorphilus gyrociliatus]|nr:DgyrCDS2484 [Dimorphilus gyrociliatus]